MYELLHIVFIEFLYVFAICSLNLQIYHHVIIIHDVVLSSENLFNVSYEAIESILKISMLQNV